MAPPMPCTKREMAIAVKFGAAAHVNDPTVKMTIAARKTFLEPHRSAA